jgi:hypothetical protein
MENFITLQDVANVVLFVIPGYFALKTYAIIYAKRERDFSLTVLESIAYSLPIVSLYSLLWEFFTDRVPIFASARYVMPLLLLSVAIGWTTALLRRTELVRACARRLRLPTNADEDFLRAQFSKLRETEFLTVALKNGEVFSGTPQSGSIMRDGAPRQYSFNDVIWYNKDSGDWEQTEGSVIIDLDEVLYFQTERQLPRD